MGLEYEGLSFVNMRACTQCGSEQEINFDHFLPQCLAGPRSMPDRNTHPFFDVVYQEFNVFPFDFKHHADIDKYKISAFLGQEEWSAARIKYLESPHRGHPIPLAKELTKYPISRDRNLRERQIFCLAVTIDAYVDAVSSLDGYFTEAQEEDYTESAAILEEHKWNLIQGRQTNCFKICMSSGGVAVAERS